MTQKEFTERTGFEPTPEEYTRIEEAYYNFDGDAEKFYNDFVSHDRAHDFYISRADEIARLKGQILDLDKQFKDECGRYEAMLKVRDHSTAAKKSDEITYADINREFSATVAEYIAKGYIINTGTMNGSQGEVAHVDLTDGNEIIRVVLMYNFATWPEKEYTIIVGRTQTNTTPNLRTNEAETIWNNELEIISSTTYTEKEVGPKEYEYRKII